MDPRPLTGEPLPLDLVNTRWSDEQGAHDLLDRSDGVRIWLRANGLARQVADTEEARESLRTVREALLGLLAPDDPKQTERARRLLNETLAHGHFRRTLGRTGPEDTVETDTPALRAPWLAAAGYLDLLDRADRIRKCADPQCTLWFLDVSKAGGRRWCSMAVCGNRAKARAHYARQHAG